MYTEKELKQIEERSKKEEARCKLIRDCETRVLSDEEWNKVVEWGPYIYYSFFGTMGNPKNEDWYQKLYHSLILQQVKLRLLLKNEKT